MALRFGASCPQTRKGSSITHHHKNAPRVVARATLAPQQQHDDATATPSSATDDVSAARYAFVRLGGVQQMLQEGLTYSAPAHLFGSSSSSSSSGNGSSTSGSGGRAVLHDVLGLRAGGSFRLGRPFVPGAAVEVEVLSTFEGPAAERGVASADDLVHVAAPLLPQQQQGQGRQGQQQLGGGGGGAQMALYRVTAISQAQQ